MGDLREAERAYREAAAYNPHFATARFHLARLLLASGQVTASRQELDAFLEEWRDADPGPELLAARAFAAQSGH